MPRCVGGDARGRGQDASNRLTWREDARKLSNDVDADGPCVVLALHIYLVRQADLVGSGRNEVHPAVPAQWRTLDLPTAALKDTGAHSGVSVHSVRGFRTPRGGVGVGDREAVGVGPWVHLLWWWMVVVRRSGSCKVMALVGAVIVPEIG